MLPDQPLEPTLPLYHSTCSPQIALDYSESTRDGPLCPLSAAENLWRDRAQYLESRGYTLRKRYRDNWIPPAGTLRNAALCDYSIGMGNGTVLGNYEYVMDATRTSDGTLVFLKAVRRTSRDYEIGLYLSGDHLKHHPYNHCNLILDVLPDPLDDTNVLLVTPYLRPYNNPELSSIGEAVDLIKQTLQGLLFMHEAGIAHRDCTGKNIVMDASSLYPQGHHPVRINRALDGVQPAVQTRRHETGVKYYFANFGMSTHFQHGDSPLVLGSFGGDHDAPELSDTIPYDAFKLDMFILGSFFYKELFDRYHGLKDLEPLAYEMTRHVPSSRPDALAACNLFDELLANISESKLRWRLQPRHEDFWIGIRRNCLAYLREGLYQLKTATRKHYRTSHGTMPE
ncbi:hypothetical protein PHLCEN_2v3743 [Hermanssonia centrifuga]|uniref:Protein kinase domain-containing protein n=1 Tax=Hermanssonia centrifuga TaxID=98765 RepID=A0A2R6QBP9_9APHY|nr:hypothetical protein PHLCEN_2v3743 [Hermanssonia centrifuga]